MRGKIDKTAAAQSIMIKRMHSSMNFKIF